jgi:hypothetical protein
MGLVLPELGEDTKERDDAVSILKVPLYVVAELRETELKPVMESVVSSSTLIVPDPEPKVRVFVPVTVAEPSEATMDAPELKVAELMVSWTLPPTLVDPEPEPLLPATILPLNTPSLIVVVTLPPTLVAPEPEPLLPATILPLNIPSLIVVVTFPPMEDVPGPEL